MKKPKKEKKERPDIANYKLIVENANEAIIVAQDGFIKYSNPAASVLTGFTAEELASKRFTEFIYPDDRALVAERYKQRIEGEELPRSYHFRVVTKEGEVKWVSISAIRMVWNRKLATMSFLADVTARKQAEEGLRKSDERFRQVAESAGEWIWEVDAEGLYTYASPVVEKVLGYRPEEIVGKKYFYDFFAPNVKENLKRAALELFSQKKPIVKLVNPNLNKRGELVYLETNGTPVLDASDNLVGYRGADSDITERKRSEEALYRRDAIINAESFAAGQFLKALEWERNIRRILERLGEATDVSRVYIFENHADQKGEILTSRRYEWVAPGISPQINNPQLHSIPYQRGGFGRWEESLSRRETIFGRIRDFPASERSVLAAQDTKSIVVVPVFVGDAWWGFFGFDDCTIERDWSVAEMEALKTVAGTLGAAIERKLADKALRESEERFRIASELASDLTYEWDIFKGELEIFGNLEAKLGHFPMPMNYDDWRGLIHPDDLSRVTAAIERHLKTGEPFYEEYRVRRGDGAYVLWTDRGFAFWDDNGNPQKMIGAITDITDRKNAEYEISEWRRRYELIVSSSGGVIYDYDLASGAIMWGGSVEAVLGYRAEEIGGGVEQRANLIHLEDRDQAQAQLETSQSNMAPYDAEYRFQHKNGNYIWIHDRGFFIAGADGKAARMLGMMLDITAGKRAEDELKLNKAKLNKAKLEEWSKALEEKVEERTAEIRRFQEMLVRQEKMAVLGQVSASISHELRTPLTGIKNSVYFLKALGVEKMNPKISDHMSIINMEVDACVRVINNMLDFVRPKEPIKKPSRLEAVVNESIGSAVMPSAIKVKTDFGKDLPTIMLDPFQMRQVFDNIVKNAIDAMSTGGGELTVTVKVDDGLAVVEFKDTGIGIAPENLNKIFDPLYSTTPTGAGLGLTIVRQFVEAHGGSIEVQSLIEKGTTFRIKLPIRG